MTSSAHPHGVREHWSWSAAGCPRDGFSCFLNRCYLYDIISLKNMGEESRTYICLSTFLLCKVVNAPARHIFWPFCLLGPLQVSSVAHSHELGTQGKKTHSVVVGHLHTRLKSAWKRVPVVLGILLSPLVAFSFDPLGRIDALLFSKLEELGDTVGLGYALGGTNKQGPKCPTENS